MRKIIKMATALLLVSAISFSGCAGEGNAEKENANPTVSENVSIQETETANEGTKTEAEPQPLEDVCVRVGSLKGPTSIGLLDLKSRSGAGNATVNCEFTMATQTDEIATALVKGEIDIALIPANLASVLYNKTEGKISVIDINTLGVLYMVSGDDGISTVSDLKGKTVYLTGKGTTPDYTLQFVLHESSVSEEVTLEYKSEASEVAALLATDSNAVGLLPQPFVTVACSKNEALKVVMSMDDEWNRLAGNTGSRLVTGVTVVRNEFLNQYPGTVSAFVKEHGISAEATADDLDRVASLAVENDIVAAEGVAKKAIPFCNITCITGEDMKLALQGYLQVLYELNPASVGGNLPDDKFYYAEE